MIETLRETAVSESQPALAMDVAPRPQSAADVLEREVLQVDLLVAKSGWPWSVKIARVLWMPFQLILFSAGGRFLSPVRIGALRLFGARIGRRVMVMDGVKVWCPWNLEIGDSSCIGFDVEIYNFATVSIGAQTVVSQYAYLCSASHRYEITTFPLYYEPIRIGSQAWIAARAFIAPGVTVGEGAVVGASSVVTRDVEPWMVVAGNPARVVRKRTLSPPSESIGGGK